MKLWLQALWFYCGIFPAISGVDFAQMEAILEAPFKLDMEPLVFLGFGSTKSYQSLYSRLVKFSPVQRSLISDLGNWTETYLKTLSKVHNDNHLY